MNAAIVERTFKAASEMQNIFSKTKHTYIDLILLVIWYDIRTERTAMLVGILL
jgi:hypothetical protein